MSDAELIAAWEELALELFTLVAGEDWEDMDEENAAAEGEWCLNLYQRIGALMAKSEQ